MLARHLHFGIAALVLRRNVLDVVGKFQELRAAIVRLAHDVLPRLGNVMLDADDIFKAKFLANVRGCFDRRVVHRVAQVETDERRRAVGSREQFRHHQRPRDKVRIVVPDVDRNLELVVEAEPMNQIANENRPRVDVQHLIDAVVGVIVQKLVEPFERVLIRLTDAAEIAGDRIGSAQMHVRAVGSLRVERVHVRRADRLHRCHPREQVALIGFRFFHVAHADKAPRHQFAIRDRLFRFDDEPREILKRADFERDRVRLLEFHRRGGIAQHLAPIIGDADERARVALRDQPFQIREVRRIHRAQSLHQIRQRARLFRLAIDLVNRPVLGDHLQHVVDQFAFGIEQEIVDRCQIARRNFQAFA